MAGLAQKGGAVACHMRVARSADDIHAIRAGVASADLIIGCDLVVAASNKVLETVRPDHTAVIYSTHEMPVADFARRPDLRLPASDLRRSIEERVRKGPVHAMDANAYAVKLFGDSIASNMFLLGFAYQLGYVPVSSGAIEQAIELNGAAIEMNRDAFRFGRLAAHDTAAIERVVQPKAAQAPTTLAEIVAFRAKHLIAYQDESLARRFTDMIARFEALEQNKAAGRKGLAEAVARGYFKLLSYKDEYEVARLYTDGRFEKAVSENFDGNLKLEFHLAPPLMSWFSKDKVTGHPRKVRLGRWMLPVFRFIARCKRLRGTPWDVFGYTAERRRERRMIAEYETLLDEIVSRLSPATHATAVELAALPEEVSGYGHVKLANYERAKRRGAALLTELRKPAPARVAAE
jgi:indolepyruvate ferredoxin oxidoreductase